MFPEGKLAPTDPSLTAQVCLQTICLLACQLKVYIDGSATARINDGGAGVTVTCGDPADSTILHWSHLRCAAFTSSFAEEAVPSEQPPRALTICTDIQSLLKTIARRSPMTHHLRALDRARQSSCRYVGTKESLATRSQTPQPQQPPQPPATLLGSAPMHP